MAEDEGVIHSTQNPNYAGIVVGNIYNIKIEDTGKHGDGIGFVNGMAIFVKGTSGAKLLGQRVNAKIMRIGRNYAQAMQV